MANARQTGLAQHALDGAVVDLELACDGAGAPALDVVITLDLCNQFRGHCHGECLWSGSNVAGDGRDSAKTRFAQKDRRRDGRSCSNCTAQTQLHRVQVMSHQGAVKQAVPQVGNPDASLCWLVCCGSNAGEQRGRGVHEGWFGSARLRLVRGKSELAWRTPCCSSGCRGRSGCK